MPRSWLVTPDTLGESAFTKKKGIVCIDTILPASASGDSIVY